MKSAWAPVLLGVTQGTILGVLQFSMYVNDILNDIELKIRIFVDGLVCYNAIKEYEDTVKLQNGIDRLKARVRNPGLKLRVRNENLTSYFSTKTYVVGTQKNRLIETVRLSTQNMC